MTTPLHAMERKLGERFKSGAVDGTVVVIRPMLGEFIVRTVDGKTVEFVGAENDYDRCSTCHSVDPTNHQWNFARAVLSGDATDPMKIADAIESLKSEMARHYRRYDIDGDIVASGPERSADGCLIFTGTVTPRLLCGDKGARG